MYELGTSRVSGVDMPRRSRNHAGTSSPSMCIFTAIVVAVLVADVVLTPEAVARSTAPMLLQLRLRRLPSELQHADVRINHDALGLERRANRYAPLFLAA